MFCSMKIKIAFITKAAFRAGILAALISGSGFDIIVLDPDGDSNAKNKIENIVKIQITNLDTLSDYGSVIVTLTGITDTAGNNMVDDDINYTFNPNPVVLTVRLNPHISG